MSQAEVVFNLGNFLILPFWAAMILAPDSRISKFLLKGPQAIVGLCVLYASLVLPLALQLLPMLAKPELEEIAKLLSTPHGAAAGWLHFLAFDLFVGRHVWRDALENNRNLIVLRVCLLFCLMFGPVGYLFYLAWRLLSDNRNKPALQKSLLFLSSSMLWLVALCLVGLALDPRSITALPAWAKPLKFALSTLIYALSLEFLLKRLEQKTAALIVRTVTSLCLGVEMLVIVLQASRGTTSHFNVETPLDSFLFGIMGFCIVPVWLMILLATALVWRERHREPNLSLAICWGGLIAFVGMAWAWPMTAQGSHTIGLPDGGPGLPILGWSTVAGDLRVAHFVGMHALQVLPLLYFLRKDSRLWIHSQGLAYLVLVCYLARQALGGQSAFSWDPILATALSAWLGSSLIALWRRASSNPRPRRSGDSG